MPRILLVCLSITIDENETLMANPLCTISRHLGALLALFLTILDFLGAVLGPAWTLLGASLGIFGTILRLLKTTFAHLGPSWEELGTILGHLEPSCAILKLFWGHLGTCLDPLGSILQPSWHHFAPF